ncbi:MAG: hypothetical protein IMW97_00005 [Firmicutes bacterium]|nr:hypothetical protein [Candidatus Fermentithermobacillaceae bacterium]
MAMVGPAEALRHPTWRMGPKITVDSATFFNKALEVIEAHYLFGIDYDRISVLVHREAIVHSMVVFKDGSVKALMSSPDMRLSPYRTRSITRPGVKSYSAAGFNRKDAFL